MKFCRCCQTLLSAESFHKSTKSKDGLHSKCKECVSKYFKTYYVLNKEKIDAKNNAWAKNNADRLREINKTKVKKSRAASSKRWRQANHDKVIAQKRTRRSRKRGAKTYVVSAKELKTLYSRPCCVCGSKINIEIDHIVPLSKGGDHSIGNLQPLCKPCNLSKSDKLFFIFKLEKRACIM